MLSIYAEIWSKFGKSDLNRETDSDSCICIAVFYKAQPYAVIHIIFAMILNFSWTLENCVCESMCVGQLATAFSNS